MGQAGLSARLRYAYADGRAGWLGHFGPPISGEKSEVHLTHEKPHTQPAARRAPRGRRARFPGCTHSHPRSDRVCPAGTHGRSGLVLRLCDAGAVDSFAFVMKKVQRWVLQAI